MLKFGKPKKGKEDIFVREFLDNNSLFPNDYIVFQEVISDCGIPDIVIATFDRDKIPNIWNEKRTILNKIDYKVLQHISLNQEQNLTKSELVTSLGYSLGQIKGIIKRLVDAYLITEIEGVFKIIESENPFFLRDIISIEAKISDTKGAIKQAFTNQTFSSKSYIMMPSPNKNNIDLGSSGYITFDGKNATIEKDAKRNNIPGSYYSWQINDYIGQLISNSNDTGINQS